MAHSLNWRVVGGLIAAIGFGFAIGEFMQARHLEIDFGPYVVPLWLIVIAMYLLAGLHQRRNRSG